jgi:hypothetical protein
MSQTIADRATFEKDEDEEEDAPCAVSPHQAIGGDLQQGMPDGELECNKKKKARVESPRRDYFSQPPAIPYLVLTGDEIFYHGDDTTCPSMVSVGGEEEIHNPSGDGETFVFKKKGDDDATGKLWWEQQADSLERQATAVDIDRYSPAGQPILWRIRQRRPFRIRAGSSILNDGESLFCIKEEVEPRFQGGDLFGALPRNLIQEILSLAIVRPGDHNRIARSCKEFSRICEDRGFVARTAAATTVHARLASQHATENAVTAHNMAKANKVKVIQFDSGEWRGARSRAKQPSGFGVFSDETTGSWSAGQWRKGEEYGPCKSKSADGSVYAGDMNKGQRQGNGVARTGTFERYEGSWTSDERHGFGLFFGGYWPFLFGRYVENQPVGHL